MVELETGREIEQRFESHVEPADFSRYAVGRRLALARTCLIVDAARHVTKVCLPSGRSWTAGVAHVYLQPTLAWAADTAHEEALRGNDLGQRDLARKLVTLRMSGWDWSSIGGLVAPEQSGHLHRLTVDPGWLRQLSPAEIDASMDASRIAAAAPEIVMLAVREEKIPGIYVAALRDLATRSEIYRFGKRTWSQVKRNVLQGTTQSKRLVQIQLEADRLEFAVLAAAE